MDTSGLKKKKEKQPISKENIKTTFKRPEVLKIILKKKSLEAKYKEISSDSKLLHTSM